MYVPRFPAVAYLECDPGQCEFTCPEVLSLHVLTEPVFGPPYVHQRVPAKYVCTYIPTYVCTDQLPWQKVCMYVCTSLIQDDQKLPHLNNKYPSM